jgi:hypothetical protein
MNKTLVVSEPLHNSNPFCNSSNRAKSNANRRCDSVSIWMEHWSLIPEFRVTTLALNPFVRTLTCFVNSRQPAIQSLSTLLVACWHTRAMLEQLLPMLAV